MRKLIACMNMTLDGFCDHTAMPADDEIHQHYSDLLAAADTVIYGRITYQLMEDYWPGVVKEPTGNQQTDRFAITIDEINKLVFSHTLREVDWKNARLATRSIEEEIRELKQQPGRDMLVGSPSMIVACTRLGLVDEFQLCVHPVIAGSGLRLLKDIDKRIELELVKTKTFGCGAVLFYHQPKNNTANNTKGE
jgi:dihydrofolate reductase